MAKNAERIFRHSHTHLISHFQLPRIILLKPLSCGWEYDTATWSHAVPMHMQLLTLGSTGSFQWELADQSGLCQITLSWAKLCQFNETASSVWFQNINHQRHKEKFPLRLCDLFLFITYLVNTVLRSIKHLSSSVFSFIIFINPCLKYKIILGSELVGWHACRHRLSVITCLLHVKKHIFTPHNLLRVVFSITLHLLH